MLYDTITGTYKSASVPSSGLRRRHSGDKRADKLYGDLQLEAQLCGQYSSNSPEKSLFGQIEEDAPQRAISGPAEMASATAALSSSSEQSSSSGWACKGVLKRFGSLPTALPRMQIPLSSSGAAAAAAGISSSSSKQEDASSIAVATTTALLGRSKRLAAADTSNRNALVTDGTLSDDVSSTAVSQEDRLRDVTGNAGPDQNQSRKTESSMRNDTGSYMEVSAPTGSAGVPSTKLLITTAAGVVGRGMKIRAAKDPRKSE